MKAVHLGSVLLKGDAISRIMLATNRIGPPQGGNPPKIVVDFFSELPNAFTLAYKDYEERQSIVVWLRRLMLLGNKHKWILLYLKARMQYRPQLAKNLIESADVRVWHYGGFYSLIRQFHARDILFYYGITYPYLVNNPEGSSLGYRSLTALRSLDPTIIVTSEFIKNDLVKQGFDPGAFRVLPLFHTYNLKYADRARHKRGKPRLLAYGRYAKNKAVPELARICSESNTELTHFGDNMSIKEFREEYKKAVKYANGIVRILPKQDKIEDFFSDSDIYVCNSYHEGFNMPAVESMAHGMPVLLRRGTAMDELITDGKEGFLFDDVSEIPELADRIMKNYGRFSLNAWKRSHFYSMENYRKRYLRILKEHHKTKTKIK